ncbi:MAG TPA: MlaD family protein [Thermoleophilaceae bacterium]|nr:MlaD family protein [Thermoleophilaceae bacterium]
MISDVRLKALGLAVFAAACLAIFVRLFVLAGGELRLSEPYSFDAVLPDAVALVTGSDVRIAGVNVGIVRTVAERGGSVVVRIELEGEYAPVRRDARLRVRTKTLVGESYIAITPGTARAPEVADGGTLPLTQTDESVQLDQIYSAFDPPTRRAMRGALSGLGGGLEGRGGDVNRVLESLSAMVEHAEPTMDVLEEERRRLALLVDDSGAVMDALAERGEQLRSLARGARVTATAVAGRDEKLRDMLEALPGTARQLERSSASLGGLAEEATPVVRDLDRGMRALVPVVDGLEPAALSGRRLIASLGRFASEADQLVDELSPFSEALSPTVVALERVLREGNPLLNHLAPYSREVGSMLANLASGVNSYDATGHVGRVHAIIDADTVTAFDGESRRALEALIEAGALTKVHLLGTNNYPAPGSLEERPQPFRGTYPRLGREP